MSNIRVSENRYEETSKLLTANYCKRYFPEYGQVNFEGLFKRLLSRWPEPSSGKKRVLYPRYKEAWSERWSDSNIERKNKNYVIYSSNTNRRLEPNKGALCKSLYKRTMQTVKGYYLQNYNIISLKEQCCLHVFLGMLSSHLLNHSEASYHYSLVISTLKCAIRSKKKWTENYNTEYINRIYKYKADKHRLRSCEPVYSLGRIVKLYPERVLASRTYAGKKDLFTIINCINTFRRIQTTRFSKLVVEVNALDALTHPRFSIILPKAMPEKIMEGAYNSLNTVIFTDLKSTQTALHELTHKAISEVFNNSSCPYFRNDLIVKKAYREAMRQVLINVVKELYSFERLICLSSRKKGKVTVQGGEGTDKSVIKFVNKWHKNMSIGELSENLFSDDRHTCLYRLFKEKRDLQIGQKIVKRNKSSKINIDFISRIKFFFKAYKPSELDVEFIANVCEYLVNQNFYEGRGKRIIKPLMDYIEVAVIPKMEEYIEKHPKRDEMRFHKTYRTSA